MRKLFIGVSVVMLAVAMPQVRSRSFPVTDGGNLIAQAKNLLQELKSYATQLEQLQQSPKRHVGGADGALFIQDPNLGTAMALMNMVGIDNPLPINPYAVQSLVSGYGGMNSLSGLTGS